jgi:hypothetical protein
MKCPFDLTADVFPSDLENDDDINRLDGNPGINRRVAEVTPRPGTEMERFPLSITLLPRSESVRAKRKRRQMQKRQNLQRQPFSACRLGGGCSWRHT